MKIRHSESGQAYQLNPGTKLEVERTNLFFNEWGEQTLPAELPDTDVNRALLGYPDRLANRNKLPARIAVTIEDGDYFMPCRQAVLDARRRTGISTSFYMNEGSFLSRIAKTALRDIFGEETVPGVKTVAEGIKFCKSLLTARHEQYAIFPVVVDGDSGQTYVNRIEYLDANGEKKGTTDIAYLRFYNEFDRVETVDGTKVLLSPGYYMSPYIRAGYLLRRIFSHFGYTLEENFFDTTTPFNEMVFVNNCMDTLVNGTILLSHLVPDCLCGTILNVYRKKFCCEFVPDEVGRTVTIEMFPDIMNAPGETDLTSCLTSPCKIGYVEHKQLKITSKSSVSDGQVFDSVVEMMAKYPEGYFDKTDGAFYHRGYTATRKNTEKIGGSTTPYSADDKLDEVEITVPDCAVPIVMEPIYTPDGRASTAPSSSRGRPNMRMPYIGKASVLNSSIVPDESAEEDESDGTDTESTSKNKEQDPILSFAYKCDLGFYLATTTNYTYKGERLSDYSLHYNGPDGIFERFYRIMDNLYRNSLNTVEAELLLSQRQKMDIPAHRKVILEGSELLIDKLKYSIGGENEPAESELLTTALYEPVDKAAYNEDTFAIPLYEWSVGKREQTITEAEYEAVLAKSDTLPAIYPPLPTEAEYKAGGEYHYRTYYTAHATRPDGKMLYKKITAYLKPVLFGK